MKDYKEYFQQLINKIGEDFIWTINIGQERLDELIEKEIKQNHPLYGKKIIPIAMCKNKLDILGFFEEKNIHIIVAIHFKGYVSTNDNDPCFNIYNDFESACNEIIMIYNHLYKNSRYQIMIDSEKIKKEKCYSTLKGLYTILPLIYDTLLKINEFRGELAKDTEEDLLRIQDLFQFFAVDFPYKIRSIIMLSEIGNYSDACIILRSLTETFFYFKYYIVKNNGKKLSSYVMQDKKNTTRIKDIMEFIAPTFYDTQYDELCNFAHGNPLSVGLFRGNVDKTDPLKYNAYNINVDWYGYILNLTMPLIVGFFNMFNQVYKNNTIKTYKMLEKNIEKVKEFIINDMNERYIVYPKQRKTIDMYRKIIEFEDLNFINKK